jgi:prepilin-type N-terminal cleavage/methylation domain-containing protein
LFQRQGGFTLVEMAVVLVIIGVILGAVMIGRDAQRNAEYLRIRQTFVNQWAVAYNSYVQRMGVPPGDNISAPNLMVNGAAFTGVVGGSLASVTEPPALCERSSGRGASRAMGGATNLRKVMLDAGIELPSGRGLGMEDLRSLEPEAAYTAVAGR